VTSIRAQSKGKRKRKAKTIILEKNPSLHCKGGGTAYQKKNLLKSNFSQTSLGFRV
jgi:hypothetical protein